MITGPAVERQAQSEEAPLPVEAENPHRRLDDREKNTIHSEAKKKKKTHKKAVMPSSDGLGRRRASHGAVSLATSDGRAPAVGFREGLGLAGIARRTLGISFLLLTVFLWTLSNFLASFIFSDETYDKPFFLVYFNTSMFALSLIPMFIRYLAQRGVHGLRSDVRRMWAQHRFQDAAASPPTDEEHDRQAHERLLVDERDPATTAMTARAAAMTHAGWSAAATGEKLDFRETAVLSFEFCMLWFMANYLASACLEYTSVASVTILTSTSSVWTLVFGSLFGVETFSLRKLVGVVASLTGIGLISMVDLSGKSDENRGSFPHKTPAQIALGDTMAFLSAVVYGIYVTVMKRRVGDEDKVNMQLFFGLVGLFNLALLWPLFFILHWTGIEPVRTRKSNPSLGKNTNADDKFPTTSLSCRPPARFGPSS